MKLYKNLSSMALLAILSAPTFADEIGYVPSAYTNYSFPAGMENGFSEVTFKTTVLTDPGRNAFVYWANEFDLGYTGLQAYRLTGLQAYRLTGLQATGYRFWN